MSDKKFKVHNKGVYGSLTKTTFSIYILNIHKMCIRSFQFSLQLKEKTDLFYKITFILRNRGEAHILQKVWSIFTNLYALHVLLNRKVILQSLVHILPT